MADKFMWIITYQDALECWFANVINFGKVKGIPNLFFSHCKKNKMQKLRDILNI